MNIPAEMKALRAYGPHDYRLDTIQVPSLKPYDILIKVEACGICAGDMKAYHGGLRFWGTEDTPAYIQPPSTGGHEIVGRIVALGDQVKGFAIGDRVVPEQILPCGSCYFCQTGTYWMCQFSEVFGFRQNCQGGFANYCKLPAGSIVHKISEKLTLEQAIMIEPIACGMHAAEIAEIHHSDVVVVAGLGPIGLPIVNIVSLKLAKKIIALDVNPERVKLATSFGADVALNPLTDDVDAYISELTDSKGCDVYIEASGSSASVKQGLNLLANHGRYVQFGVLSELVTTDWNIIGDGKELTIKGSHLSGLTFASTIKGIETGLIKTHGLVSEIVALDNWKQAFETLETRKDVMKIALSPKARVVEA